MPDWDEVFERARQTAGITADEDEDELQPLDMDEYDLRPLSSQEFDRTLQTEISPDIPETPVSPEPAPEEEPEPDFSEARQIIQDTLDDPKSDEPILLDEVDVDEIDLEADYVDPDIRPNRERPRRPDFREYEEMPEPEVDWGERGPLGYVASFADSLWEGANRVFHGLGEFLYRHDSMPDNVGRWLKDVTRDPREEPVHPDDVGFWTDQLPEAMGSGFAYLASGAVAAAASKKLVPLAIAGLAGGKVMAGASKLAPSVLKKFGPYFAGSVPSTSLIAASSTGHAAKQAEDLGWDDDEIQEMMNSHFAKQYLWNVGLQAMSLGITMSPAGGFSKSMMKKLGGGITGKLGFYGSRLGMSAGNEFIQESGMDIITHSELGQPIDWGEIAYGSGVAALSSALTTGVTGAPMRAYQMSRLGELQYMSDQNLAKLQQESQEYAETFRQMREETDLDEFYFQNHPFHRDTNPEMVGRTAAIEHLKNTDNEFSKDYVESLLTYEGEIKNRGKEEMAREMQETSISEFLNFAHLLSEPDRIINTALSRLESLAEQEVVGEEVFVSDETFDQMAVSSIINNATESDNTFQYIQNRKDFLNFLSDESTRAQDLLNYFEAAERILLEQQGLEEAETAQDGEFAKMVHLGKELGIEYAGWMDPGENLEHLGRSITIGGEAELTPEQIYEQEMTETQRELFDRALIPEMEDLEDGATINIIEAVKHPTVLAHEIGHVIHRMHERSDDLSTIEAPDSEEAQLLSYAIDQEIQPLLQNITGNPEQIRRQMPTEDYTADAIATYLRFPDLAKKLAPNWTDQYGENIKQFVAAQTDRVDFEPSIVGRLPIDRVVDQLDVMQAEADQRQQRVEQADPELGIFPHTKSEDEMEYERQINEIGETQKQRLKQIVAEKYDDESAQRLWEGKPEQQPLDESPKQDAEEGQPAYRIREKLEAIDPDLSTRERLQQKMDEIDRELRDLDEQRDRMTPEQLAKRRTTRLKNEMPLFADQVEVTPEEVEQQQEETRQESIRRWAEIYTLREEAFIESKRQLIELTDEETYEEVLEHSLKTFPPTIDWVGSIINRAARLAEADMPIFVDDPITAADGSEIPHESLNMAVIEERDEVEVEPVVETETLFEDAPPAEEADDADREASPPPGLKEAAESRGNKLSDQNTTEQEAKEIAETAKEEIVSTTRQQIEDLEKLRAQPDKLTMFENQVRAKKEELDPIPVYARAKDRDGATPRVEGFYVMTSRTGAPELIKNEFNIVDLNDLIHSLSEEAPGDGEALQDRGDRVWQKVKETAAQWLGGFAPRLFVEGPSAEHGGPITDDRGLVVGGHLRTMVLEHWYKFNINKPIQKYHNEIKRQAELLGFTQEEVEQALEEAEMPILVRRLTERDTPEDMVMLSRLTNASAVEAKQSVVLSRNLSEGLERYIIRENKNVFDDFNFTTDSRVGNPENKVFLDHVYHAGVQQLGRATTEKLFNMKGEGDIHSAAEPLGEWIIRYALFDLAYNHKELLFDVAARPETGVNNILKALAHGAPKVAELNMAVAREEADGAYLQLINELVGVVYKYNEVKKRGKKVEDFVGKANMQAGLGDYADASDDSWGKASEDALRFSDTEVALIRLLQEESRRYIPLRNTIHRYAKLALEQPTIGESELLKSENQVLDNIELSPERLSPLEAFARAYHTELSHYAMSEKGRTYDIRAVPLLEPTYEARKYHVLQNIVNAAREEVAPDASEADVANQVLEMWPDIKQEMELIIDQFKWDDYQTLPSHPRNEYNMTHTAFHYLDSEISKDSKTFRQQLVEFMQGDMELNDEAEDRLIKQKFRDFSKLAPQVLEEYHERATEEWTQEKQEDLDAIETVVNEYGTGLNFSPVGYAKSFLEYLRENFPRAYDNRTKEQIVEDYMRFNKFNKRANDNADQERQWPKIYLTEQGDVVMDDQKAKDAGVVFEASYSHLLDSPDVTEEQAERIREQLINDFERIWPEVQKNRSDFTFDKAVGQAMNLNITLDEIEKRMHDDLPFNAAETAWLATMQYKKTVEHDRLKQKEDRTEVEDQRLLELTKELETIRTAWASGGTEQSHALAARKMRGSDAIAAAITERMDPDASQTENALTQQEMEENYRRGRDTMNTIDILKEYGKVEINDEIRKEVLQMDDPRDQVEIRKIWDKYVSPDVRNLVEYYWISNVLSGPRTQLRNHLGSGLLMLTKPSQRFGQGLHDLIARTLGEDDLTVHEAKMSDFGLELLGWWDGLGEAIRNAKKGMLHGVAMTETFGAEEMDTFVREPVSNFWGKLLYPHNRFMLAGDQFYRTMGQYGARNVMAYRAARKFHEQGKHEHLSLEELAHEIKNNPDMVDGFEQLVKEEGAELVLHQDPNTELGRFMTNFFSKLRRGEAFDGVPHWIQWMMGSAGMFMRTGVNMMEIGTKMVSPLGGASAVKKWIDAKQMMAEDADRTQIRDKIRSARRDAGLATAGMFALTGATIMAFMGGITGSGPDDPRDRARLYDAGWQPYSMRIPGTDYFVGYRYLFPFNYVFGAVANMAENIMYNPRMQSDNAWEQFEGVVDGTIRAVRDTARYAADHSVFYTVSRWWDYLSGHDVRGQPAADPLTGFIPYVGLSNTIRQALEPEMTDPDGVWDILREPIPEVVRDKMDPIIPWADFAEPIPRMRNRFGQAIEVEGPLDPLGVAIPARVSEMDIDLADFQRQAQTHSQIEEAMSSGNEPYEFERAARRLPREARDFATAGYVIGRFERTQDFEPERRANEWDQLRDYISDDVREWMYFHHGAEEQGYRGNKYFASDRRMLLHDGEYLAELMADRLGQIQTYEGRMERLNANLRFFETFKYGHLPQPEREAKLKALTRRLYKIDERDGRGLFER